MSGKKAIIGALGILAAGFLAAGMFVPAALAQSGERAASTGTRTPFRNRPNLFSRRAGMYYGLYWGVDSLAVKAVESGEIIRFTYRVLDGDKARPLNDKKVDPALICREKGVKLIVPSLEKVGQLRQSSTPEAGKTYWMAFSNSGRVIKRGDRVAVVIGNFRAEGLVVE